MPCSPESGVSIPMSSISYRRLATVRTSLWERAGEGSRNWMRTLEFAIWEQSAWMPIRALGLWHGRYPLRSAKTHSNSMRAASPPEQFDRAYRLPEKRLYRYNMSQTCGAGLSFAPRVPRCGISTGSGPRPDFPTGSEAMTAVAPARAARIPRARDYRRCLRQWEVSEGRYHSA
jgi:hypothetical protein